MSGETDDKEDNTSVRVAIRIRPQNGREKIDMCQTVTSVTEHQVLLGKDKAFTFDYVYDTPTQQESIYNTCVRGLIEGCFEGYNATVFAYGQTGSGKTYTMGTGFEAPVVSSVTDEIGIVPRAVDHLFLGIEERRRQAFENGEAAPDFKVTVQFMELYNEEIIDLLDTTRDPESRGHKSHNRIHEDASGGIYVVGVTTRPVSSLEETLQCLKSGALSRSTASTNMNVSSSRSHAIFSLHIRQHRLVKEEIPLEDGKETDSTQAEFETLTAKFHFVDLAGSERLKRTGATGDRAKEGISINCGLLALGNVISALGDKTKKGCHVPYRDSKLTRLLQDSLGGNSRTLMIACISPSDRDFMETLNTLKYANRARNIKNKVMANQDKASKQLAMLRSEIMALQQELMEYKTGKRTIDADGLESVNDMVTENSMLQSENDKLRQRIKALQETVDSLNAKNIQLLSEAALFSVLGADGQASNEDVSNLIKKYIQEIEELKVKLAESEFLCEQLRKVSMRNPSSPVSRMSMSTSMSGSLSMSASMSMSTSSFAGGFEGPASPEYTPEHSILHKAKKDVKRLKKLHKSLSHDAIKDHSSCNGGQTGDDGGEDEQATSQEKSEDEQNEENGADLEEQDISDESDTSETDSSSDLESEVYDYWVNYCDISELDNVHEDLAKLTCDITIKKKLIDELEQTQKKMNSLKVHYESKVQQLTLKIKETEMERDKVLANIDKVSQPSAETSKKVKLEYEKKLNQLQEELRKMQAEQKKHARVQKNSSHYEQQMKTLQHELSEMKKTKVKLIKQVKEEVDKNKHNEARRSKEVSQLKKEQLRKDNIIKHLERQTIQKDAVLKRKQEEVEALRKRQKPMSLKAAGRVGKYDKPNTIPIAPVPSSPTRRKWRSKFQPKVAKQKWDSLERNVMSVITKRQTITMLERDMDIWLKQREKCTKEIEKYERRKKDALANNQPEEVIRKLSKVIDDISFKVEHAQENINECQSNIMQMEESKEDGDSNVEVSALIESMSLEEAKYVIEKFYHRALDKGLVIAQRESELRELQGRLHQTELNNALQQDLLRHMMDDHVNIEVDNLMTENDPDDMESTSSSSSSSPAESMLDSAVVFPASRILPTSESLARREKARRKTTTPQELLYVSSGDTGHGLLPLLESPYENKDVNVFATINLNHVPPTVDVSEVVGDGGDMSPMSPDAANSTEDEMEERLLAPPPRMLAKPKSVLPRPSPVLRRKEVESSPILSRRALSRSSSMGDTSSDTTPPASPTMARRMMSRSTDENVFSRLTSNSGGGTSANPDRGNIVPSSSSSSRSVGPGKAMLTCTHTAEGHTKAVLSVFATDHLLFTGSKDRTAKTWDLGTGKELISFPGHPNNVLKVCFCPRTQLVFTISQSAIRVWDMRRGADACIKTLSSSGLTTNGLATFSTGRLTTDSTYREHQINDMKLTADGNTIFCGAGNVVQIWDLRRYSQCGRLSGHQAPVMSLALHKDSGHTMVISGSKDHYIKIFEVIEDAAGVLNPKYNLEPPHYDGIQSLAIDGSTLFSGSRDMCIKKWDLNTKQLKQSINAAHKDWVCALDFVPGTNLLLSGCRGGLLKMWQPETCANLGEIKAHASPINAIATNSSAIFTASNDCVGIWRPRSSLDLTDTSDTNDDSTTVSA
ncbi:kinesin-like protein KIF21A isoform X3 [Biomphalaria glabrata]|uniref:Kinesin-like protein KIF21A isoform X3 n=1 Tax=Biomphalaria glabrata TaxID=6526 RepID=A0A9W3BJQ4_BIOGL|nr:kinesin-like protein KIF21A isoform X3 [Biomphalaria glabrata]